MVLVFMNICPLVLDSHVRCECSHLSLPPGGAGEPASGVHRGRDVRPVLRAAPHHPGLHWPRTRVRGHSMELVRVSWLFTYCGLI